jgi:type I restriction enzyme S subunit
MAIEILGAYQTGQKMEHEIVSYVTKTDIEDSGDFNLTGDKYKPETNTRVSGWPMVQLGDLVNVMNGFAFKSDLYSSSGIRVIRITNVQKGFVKDDDPKFYPLTEKKEISKYELFENDLLVSLTGNVGRVALLPKSFLPAALNQRVACLRILDDSKINHKYLYYLLNLDNFEEKSIDAASGVAQKNLSTEWLKTFEIPLPPIEIQSEIVSELDEAMRQIESNLKKNSELQVGMASKISQLWN